MAVGYLAVARGRKGCHWRSRPHHGGSRGAISAPPIVPSADDAGPLASGSNREPKIATKWYRAETGRDCSGALLNPVVVRPHSVCSPLVSSYREVDDERRDVVFSSVRGSCGSRRRDLYRKRGRTRASRRRTPAKYEAAKWFSAVGRLQMTQSIISAAEARIGWVSSARCRSTDSDELTTGWSSESGAV